MTEQQSTTGFANLAEARLYYEVAGEGYPLLLLHAGIADSRMWDDQFSVFARYYRVIRYDLPGFGKSEMPPGLFSNHEAVAGLLDRLGVERACVVGLSFGSRIAIDFTLAHPKMVRALVLAAPSVGGETSSEAMRQYDDAEEAALERGDLEAATELNLRMWVDGPHRTPDQVDPAMRERVREMQLHAFAIPTPAGAEERRSAPPAITRLAEIRVPTLVVIGTLDIQEKVTLANQVAVEIPGAEQVVIPGVAHMINMEQPEAFNRVVLDFLDKQRDGSA